MGNSVPLLLGGSSKGAQESGRLTVPRKQGTDSELLKVLS